MSKVETSGWYISVRRTKDDGREWFDIHSLSGLLEETREKTDKLNSKIPQWAEFNPVVRYTTVKIIEL